MGPVSGPSDAVCGSPELVWPLLSTASLPSTLTLLSYFPRATTTNRNKLCGHKFSWEAGSPKSHISSTGSLCRGRGRLCPRPLPASAALGWQSIVPTSPRLHMAVLPLCLCLLSLLSFLFYDTSHCIAGPPESRRTSLKALNSVTSAKTLLPKQVMFTGTRGQDFGGPSSSRCDEPTAPA